MSDNDLFRHNYQHREHTIKALIKSVIPQWMHLNPFFRGYTWLRPHLRTAKDSLLIYLFKLLIFLNIKIASVYHELGLLTANAWGKEIVKSNCINSLREEAVGYFKAALKINERYMVSYRPLISQLMGQMDFAEAAQVMQKYYNIKQDIARERQLDKFGVRFIPSVVFTGNYGSHVHMDAYIKSKLLGFIPPDRSISLLPEGVPVSNSWMCKRWEQYITYINDDSSVIYRFAEVCKLIEDDVDCLIVVDDKAVWTNEAIGLINRRWEAEGHKPLLELNADEIALGWKELRIMGMPEGSWFVALHVREFGFKNEDEKNVDLWDAHRNADIRTYHKAIQAIVDRGGWVLRMGDSNMKPIDHMEHVIDYANSSIRSDFMDAFCCAQCKFYVGTNAGLQAFPEIFNVPMVLTNYVSMTARARASNQIVLYKLLRSTIENRYLTFEEGLQPPIGNATCAVNYRELDIEWVDNTEDEICDSVVEMLDHLDGRIIYSDEDEIMQDQFNKLHNEYSNWGGLGRTSRDFLRNYQYLLPQ
jgi:putative glycosyltransferase (TIGR04372 family)